MSRNYTPQKVQDAEYFRLMNLKKELEAQLQSVKVALRPYLYHNPNVKKDEH